MNEEEFKQRTKQIALRVIRLTEALPKTPTAQVISRQLLRASTSVGANYRAACRAKSVSDLIAKLSIVEEETDECLYWIELLIEANVLPEAKVSRLMAEIEEILAMTVSSIKTLRNQKNQSKI